MEQVRKCQDYLEMWWSRLGESVTKSGWLPKNKWKFLSLDNDYVTINKIVSLVNSAKTDDYNLNHYGQGKAIEYPVSMVIKLNNKLLRIHQNVWKRRKAASEW
jgi:hypothetical protein